MTTTTYNRHDDVPAILTDAEWTSRADIAETSSLDGAGYTYTVKVLEGDGEQYFVYATRTAPSGRVGGPTLEYGKYLADDTTLIATITAAVAAINPPAAINLLRTVLIALPGAAVDGSGA